jgi:hypothetical protein
MLLTHNPLFCKSFIHFSFCWEDGFFYSGQECYHQADSKYYFCTLIKLVMRTGLNQMGKKA